MLCEIHIPGSNSIARIHLYHRHPYHPSILPQLRVPPGVKDSLFYSENPTKPIRSPCYLNDLVDHGPCLHLFMPKFGNYSPSDAQDRVPPTGMKLKFPPHPEKAMVLLFSECVFWWVVVGCVVCFVWVLFFFLVWGCPLGVGGRELFWVCVFFFTHILSQSYLSLRTLTPVTNVRLGHLPPTKKKILM